MDILYSNEVNQYLTPAELTVLLQTNRAVIKQSYGGIHAPTARFFKFYWDGEIRKHHNIKVTAMPKIRENKSFMIQGSNPTNNCTLHYRFVHFQQLFHRNRNLYLSIPIHFLALVRSHSCACECFTGGNNGNISICSETFSPNWSTKTIKIRPAPPATTAQQFTDKVHAHLMELSQTYTQTLFVMAHLPDSEAPLFLLVARPLTVHPRNIRSVPLFLLKLTLKVS